jgi:hypothetical protein
LEGIAKKKKEENQNKVGRVRKEGQLNYKILLLESQGNKF